MLKKLRQLKRQLQVQVVGTNHLQCGLNQQRKKDWGPSRKTQIPGGGFVKIKKKCTKFPYCNQGDISNVKISKNESVKEAIKRVSNRIGVSENTIITILEHEYEKMNKRAK